ncbi:hypothetical protein B7494_g7202 [Chlorociboria aeruginascens]|nr:hypothetical protein B7494_g7202 [Chlorociboria aeruginascens]
MPQAEDHFSLAKTVSPQVGRDRKWDFYERLGSPPPEITRDPKHRSLDEEREYVGMLKCGNGHGNGKRDYKIRSKSPNRFPMAEDISPSDTTWTQYVSRGSNLDVKSRKARFTSPTHPERRLQRGRAASPSEQDFLTKDFHASMPPKSPSQDPDSRPDSNGQTSMLHQPRAKTLDRQNWSRRCDAGSELDPYHLYKPHPADILRAYKSTHKPPSPPPPPPTSGLRNNPPLERPAKDPSVARRLIGAALGLPTRKKIELQAVEETSEVETREGEYEEKEEKEAKWGGEGFGGKPSNQTREFMDYEKRLQENTEAMKMQLHRQFREREMQRERVRLARKNAMKGDLGAE